MIALDSDHISVLKSPDSRRRDRLVARMATSIDDEFGVSIVTTAEQMRGWLSAIARERLITRQVSAYRELATLFEFFVEFAILPFDDVAAAHFDRLRPSLRRLGTMDLKIACTALSAGVLLLTANRSDFGQVPGLRIENWLD